MAHQQPQPRERLEPDQFMALWQACDSDDTAPLEHLIKTLDATVDDLHTGLSVAIKHNHLNMVRHLLDRGVAVNGYIVREALHARSIPVLEMLREFGGWEVNMKVDAAMTALKWVIS